MQTTHTTVVSKNDLWLAYQMSSPIVKEEIILELKKVGLLRHWHVVASKAHYDLRMAKAPLRDIFLKLMPETAPLFGVKTATA